MLPLGLTIICFLGLHILQWLMHFPQAMPDIPENPDFITLERPTFNETWADMEKIYESGKVKTIGVSNFSVKKYV